MYYIWVATATEFPNIQKHFVSTATKNRVRTSVLRTLHIHTSSWTAVRSRAPCWGQKCNLVRNRHEAFWTVIYMGQGRWKHTVADKHFSFNRTGTARTPEMLNCIESVAMLPDSRTVGKYRRLVQPEQLCIELAVWPYCTLSQTCELYVWMNLLASVDTVPLLMKRVDHLPIETYYDRRRDVVATASAVPMWQSLKAHWSPSATQTSTAERFLDRNFDGKITIAFERTLPSKRLNVGVGSSPLSLKVLRMSRTRMTRPLYYAYERRDRMCMGASRYQSQLHQSVSIPVSDIMEGGQALLFVRVFGLRA